MPSRVRHWCFTLNNYTDDDFSGLSSLPTGVSYLCVGREVGSEGTPHLQGFLSFSNPRQLSGLRRTFFGGRAHWEPARSPGPAAEYCKKEGDYIELGHPPAVVGSGARSDIEAFKEAVKGGLLDIRRLREEHSSVCARHARFVSDYIKDHTPPREVEQHDLREWQRDLLAKLDGEPDSRTIIFVVDRSGNTGKSWFADYYHSLHPLAVQVLNPGKKADMALALNPSIRVLIIDAPRSKQGEYIQYDFLEDVKNGRVFSGKYESGMKYLNKVHVVVMMNEDPDYQKLSIDRYDVISLDEPIHNILN